MLGYSLRYCQRKGSVVVICGDLEVRKAPTRSVSLFNAQYFKEACISTGFSKSGSSNSPYMSEKISFKVISDDHNRPSSAIQT
jgi:hypothetical protein